MGFISGADDKDKANVNWLLLGAVLFGGALLGLLFLHLEHTVPVRRARAQAAASLARGELDFFQLPRMREGTSGRSRRT